MSYFAFLVSEASLFESDPFGAAEDDDISPEADEREARSYHASVNRSSSLQTAGVKLKPCAADEQKEEESWDSDEEGADMGFGLFDDEVPSISFTSAKRDAPSMREKGESFETVSSADANTLTTTFDELFFDGKKS